jgi:hypothetical protein
MRSRLLAGLAAVAVVVAVGACGGSSGTPVNPNGAEVSPPGDIPDNQAFVAYSPPGGGYSVEVPEGWSRTASGGAVTFTDKLNSIRMEAAAAGGALTRQTAKQIELPKLAKAVKGFQPGSVSAVSRSAGPAVRITYLADGKADQVTGKARQNAVERYVFFHKGRRVVLTLSGPKGADNVDPWKLVTDSLRWKR